jgi:putative flippase GtrA
MFRYTMVSVVAVPVGLIFDILALDVLKWSPGWSGIFGAGFGAVPSYYLNRSWAWGKTGRSHVWKEIVPFWAIALVSTLFAGWTQRTAGNWVKRHDIIGLERQVIILGAYLFGFGVLWIVKYVIFNTVLFKVQHAHDGLAHTHAEAREAGFAGAAGVPELD